LIVGSRSLQMLDVQRVAIYSPVHVREVNEQRTDNGDGRKNVSEADSAAYVPRL